MGKTRDLFKKIRDTKGTFHAKRGAEPRRDSAWERLRPVACEGLWAEAGTLAAWGGSAGLVNRLQGKEEP